MSRDNNQNQLIAKLYAIACASLSSANSGNPFISRSEAMRDINRRMSHIRHHMTT